MICRYFKGCSSVCLELERYKDESRRALEYTVVGHHSTLYLLSIPPLPFSSSDDRACMFDARA